MSQTTSVDDTLLFGVLVITVVGFLDVVDVIIVVVLVKLLIIDEIETPATMFVSFFEELLIWHKDFITENDVCEPNFVKSKKCYSENIIL